MSAESVVESIPPGYKQTEVGMIPEDWKVLSLSESSKRITDGEHLTPKRSSSGYYLLSARNILNGRINLLEVDYVGESEYRRIRQRCNPETGDVLISCSGTVGRVAIVPDGLECVMVRSAALVKPDTEKHNGLYVQYFLQSSAGQQQISSSLNQGAQANLFLNHIHGLHVAFPPTLAEQEAIAIALSDTDALIESLEQLIAKKRQIKQGAMQELLTGKKRLPGFSGEWETKNVSEFGDIVTGGTPCTDAEEFWGDGYPWITPTDISTHRDMYTSERTLTLKGLNVIRPLPKNTVLVTCIASIGKNAILRAEGGCNQQINAIIPNSNSSPEFLYYIFEANKQLLLANAGTTATSIVSKNTFGQLTFKVPSLHEQTAIATILSDMDAEITALEEKLAKTRQIKQGMMQELLTGRIRLV